MDFKLWHMVPICVYYCTHRNVSDCSNHITAIANSCPIQGRSVVTSCPTTCQVSQPYVIQKWDHTAEFGSEEVRTNQVMPCCSHLHLTGGVDVVFICKLICKLKAAPKSKHKNSPQVQNPMCAAPQLGNHSNQPLFLTDLLNITWDSLHLSTASHVDLTVFSPADLACWMRKYL